MNDPIVFTVVMFGHALVIAMALSYAISKLIPEPKNPVSELFTHQFTKEEVARIQADDFVDNVKPITPKVIKFKTQAQVAKEKALREMPVLPTKEEMDIEFNKTIK